MAYLSCQKCNILDVEVFMFLELNEVSCKTRDDAKNVCIGIQSAVQNKRGVFYCWQCYFEAQLFQLYINLNQNFVDQGRQIAMRVFHAQDKQVLKFSEDYQQSFNQVKLVLTQIEEEQKRINSQRDAKIKVKFMKELEPQDVEDPENQLQELQKQRSSSQFIGSMKYLEDKIHRIHIQQINQEIYRSLQETQTNIQTQLREIEYEVKISDDLQKEVIKQCERLIEYGTLSEKMLNAAFQKSEAKTLKQKIESISAQLQIVIQDFKKHVKFEEREAQEHQNEGEEEFMNDLNANNFLNNIGNNDFNNLGLREMEKANQENNDQMDAQFQ